MKFLAATCALLAALCAYAFWQEEEARDALADALDLADTCADRAQIAEDTLTLMFGEAWHPDRLTMDTVTVTAYQSRRGQTDATPHINASNTSVMTGQIAVSRDIGLRFGQVVHLVDMGSFVVADLMGPSKRKQVDIWTGQDGKAARLHGVRETTAIWLQ